MSLGERTRLGAYEITGLIGAGGMGEVYRARDTRLGREVAIKTLPAALALDKDRLARFEREAKLLATLNHPHIAAVHSLDEHDGTLYLAMELVEGETLEEKLLPGALPVEDALRMALQIAEALEAAHAKGVIHRDLKPANIMLNTQGQVKVLDFGLAKAFGHEPAEASPGQSPALSLAMTQQGFILGTAGYMSPEQASGQATDQRADIWAFGVVLYEMLTGLPLFRGESVPHILADVLKSEPDWKKLPRNLHPRLKLMLERCLAKKPRNRYHSIADARVDLEQALSDPAGVTPPPAAAAAARSSAFTRIGLPVATLLAGAAVAGLAVWLSRLPDAAERGDPPTRLALVPEGKSVEYGIALSPDSRRLVYSSEPVEGGLPRLWLQELDRESALELAGTEGALYPFWSPDGASVGFFAAGSLKKIGIASRAVQTLSEASTTPQGGSWGSDGRIIFGGGGVIQQVPENGGEPQVIRAPDPSSGAVSFDWPSFLPDGRRFVYTARQPYGTGAIYVGSTEAALSSDEVLLESDTRLKAEYADPGYLFYVDASGLLVVDRFDADTAKLSREPTPVSAEVLATPWGYAPFSVRSATVIYQTLDNTDYVDMRLMWLDREGRIAQLLGGGRNFWGLAISPSGDSIAVTQDDSVFSYDAGGENLRLTTYPAVEYGAVWAPDGRRFAFGSIRNGAEEVFLGSVEPGEGDLLIAAPPGVDLRAEDWSADGRYLLVRREDALSVDIWRYDFEQKTFSPLIASRYDEYQAQLSPDGEWVAYTSTEAGQGDVYVATFPGLENRVRFPGGSQPRWRADGQELYYLTVDGSLMMAPRSVSGSFRPADAARLFDMDRPSAGVRGGYLHYDVSPDGQRFLVITPGSSGVLSAYQNWQTALE